MAPTVKTVSSCIIIPSSPTPPQHMFLAAQDILWRWFHYNQRILFFKLEQPHQAAPFIQRLKSSLALALVEFFPWAGRLFEQADGRLALDCNDAGVPFIEASIDLPFSCLETDGFQYNPIFKQFAPHGDILEWTGPDLPLLSVQVTRFQSDEGLVVGFGNNHSVADGCSLWHFMKSWGECARGLPISMRPLHMREELRLEKLILPPAPQGDEANVRSITQGGKLDKGPPDNEEYAQRDFRFTSEMVKKLKQMADASFPEAGHAPFSSLQALSAHIWKHVIAATSSLVDEAKKSVLFLLANMRTRGVPPLPEAYFGNLITRDGTVATSDELQEESLGATAMRIRELAKSLDDKRMKTLCGWMEVLHPSKLAEGIDFSMVLLQVSGSPRFPVYEVDFGWGPPVCVRSPLIRGNGEMQFLAGREGGGSVDVSLNLTKPLMEILEQDEGFLSF